MRVSPKTISKIEDALVKALRANPTGLSGAKLVRALTSYPEATIRRVADDLVTRGTLKSVGVKATRRYLLAELQ